MLEVRNVRLSFKGVPRHWFGGHVAATHLSNALNLLFPGGERFFIRSVRHYVDRFDEDQELQEQVRAFFGQEGNHAREHQRFFETLESQGYEISHFLDLYERIQFGWVERLMPPLLRLSATAACEHFTASLADNALRSPVFDSIDPRMRRLLLWHAAEEIEHKSVAFDVLERVNPSYAVRVAGLAFATLFLLSWWAFAFRTLVGQDGLTVRQALAGLARGGFEGRERPPQTVIRDAILEYLQPGFHPWNLDNSELARRFTTSMAQA